MKSEVLDLQAPAGARPLRVGLPSITTLVCVAIGITAIAAALSSTYYLLLLTFAATYLVAAMGLNVLTGYTGIVSVAHGALVCVGAYATAIATVRYGWGFWPAAGLSALIGLAFSAVLGLPALRLSSWYFVLITIAFTLAVTAMLDDLRSLTGGYGGIIGVPRPTFMGGKLGERATFGVLVAIVLAFWWLLDNLMRSRIGWALRSIREGNIRAQANGVSTRNIKMFAFAFSGAAAGFAGAFYAAAKVVVTPEDFSFDFSIFFLFVVVLGGPARLAGPLLGVAAFYVLPELLGSLKEYRMIVYGVGLLAFSIFLPEGLAGALAEWDERLRARRRAPSTDLALPQSSAVRPSQAASPHHIAPVDAVGVTVRDVVKRFGGVCALDGVSLTVEPGHIHAIVGPNGSGKTTLLNVVSGFYRADSGSIRLGAQELVGLTPTSVSRQGVQRTFQTPKLLAELTVLENTRFGAYARERASGVEIAFKLPRARSEAMELDTEAARLLALVGLEHRMDERGGLLPHGQQRLVEIARSLIGRPRLLLLDEPAAGLSMGELEQLGELMRAIRKMGITLIMVEHHIELIANIADSVTVLDQGRILASGTAADVFANADVVRAYTGVTQ